MSFNYDPPKPNEGNGHPAPQQNPYQPSQPVAPTPDQNTSGYNFQPATAYGYVPEAAPTGRTSALTIVGFVCSIVLPLVGFILSIVAWRQAIETGDNRGLAKAGIIVGAVLTVLNLLFTFLLFGEIMSASAHGTMSSST